MSSKKQNLLPGGVPQPSRLYSNIPNGMTPTMTNNIYTNQGLPETQLGYGQSVYDSYHRGAHVMYSGQGG